MAFGKKGTDAVDPTNENTENTENTEPKADEKVVAPEGSVSVIDFARNLTFERVAAANGNPGEADYVSVNEVYGWISAGMATVKVGDKKRGGIFVLDKPGREFLATFVPGKRGRSAMTDEDKAKGKLAKALAQAAALGIDVSAIQAAVAASAVKAAENAAAE